VSEGRARLIVSRPNPVEFGDARQAGRQTKKTAPRNPEELFKSSQLRFSDARCLSIL
jgi:hypothetical protein